MKNLHDEQAAIQEIVEKYGLRPVYTYTKNRHEIHRSFTIKWTFYYNTPALMHEEKVFLKILLDPSRHEDFLSQIRFHTYLEQQPFTVFKIPKLLHHGTAPLPYAIFSFVQGKLLGSLSGTRGIFATKDIAATLKKGITEVQSLLTPDSNWKRVKDFEWFCTLLKDLQTRLQGNFGEQYVSSCELAEIGSLLKKLAPIFSVPSVPLLGDLSPSNIIVEKKKLWIFDQAPFTIGNPYADMAEFLSYGLVNQKWQERTRMLSRQYTNKPLLYLNLLLFITNRIVNECELLQLFGKRKSYLHNIQELKKQKEYYLQLLKKYA